MFRVRVTGDKWWKDRVYYLSTGGLEREGSMPALKELDKAFRSTLTMLFKPGGGPGVEYEHGDTGNYLMNLHSVVTPNSLQIIEGSPTGGREIREGGPPGNWGDIVAWAKRKLGASTQVAERIADSLKSRGFIGGGSSPIKSEHPAGQPRFAFPEWIVTVKNKDDIEKASQRVSSLIVRYLR